MKQHSTKQYDRKRYDAEQARHGADMPIFNAAGETASAGKNDSVIAENPNDSNVSGISRLPRIARLVCSVSGVAIAAAIVWVWFPHGAAAWTNPLHEIDAPAHYYFIRKILDEGIGAATHLWPNDEYYPPLFHLLAAGLIKLAGLFGVNLSIYAAFNTVWLATSGLIWPISIQLYASYFTRHLSDSDDTVRFAHSASARRSASSQYSSHSPHSNVSARAIATSLLPAVLALIIPSLAVASACHPFQMLASGPLIAFGLATTLLPFWLYATLRLLDAIAAHEHLVKWSLLFLATAGICMFAHPRIVFTWLLLMAPFILTRLPWKAIAGLAVVVALGAGAFLAYMMSSYQSDRYFNPASWFHTFVPNRTVPEALRVYFTDNIAGAQGWFIAAIVLISLAVTIAAIIRPQIFVSADSAHARTSDVAAKQSQRQPVVSETVSDDVPVDGAADVSVESENRRVSAVRHTPRSEASRLRRDAIAIALVFFLVGLVYVCSTALTGWFPNIVAAAWYRAETRPLTMIPFGVASLIIFAAAVLLRAGRLPDVTKIAAVVVLTALIVSCQFGNTVRSGLSDAVYSNMTIDDSQPDEQLTSTKERILKKMVGETGTDSVVVSDPLNGSMYATAMYGADMLFPIYNPKAEKNGAIYGQTERAFASGDGRELTNTVCPLSEDGDAYFLSMGAQAPSLQMFTFKQQYDTFHDQQLIDKYAGDGTMTKIQDYSGMSSDAKGWALYRFNCR